MIQYRLYLFNKPILNHIVTSLNSSLKYLSIKKTSEVSHTKNIADKKVMRILNVAEKNDAAKGIAGLLSGGHSNRRDGFSPYNKIYEFTCNILGQNAQMVMTSVSGHMLEHSFVGVHKIWKACRPVDLFTAPVVKSCPENYRNIQRTLEREVRSCQILIIWTDCDREGENIGFEIIDTCRAVKPNITVYRAKFSEITGPSIRRSIQQLAQPDKKLSDAVDVRSELDLRIGAAFTRFQTLRLQRVFPNSLEKQIISYGSCQFPTLGFVVERYRSVKEFIPEPFWKISVNHTIKDVSVDFLWRRNRLFNEMAVVVLHDDVMEYPTAYVTKVDTKPKSKWRPLPLDTVASTFAFLLGHVANRELEKQASRKLRLTAKETMRVAESLYTRGFISYPRTETNKFPPEMNLRQLIEDQIRDNRWGEFAARIVENGPNPRQGTKSDQAHPPIHPTKYADNLQGNDQRVYEFVVRHFLACCDKDAQGMETVVEIRINKEEFVATGLLITERNYLDVYPYEKWNSKEIHEYRLNETFEPTRIEVTQGQTSRPNLLTEADLIALMEKHGIGTDATHADHIDKIKTREYVGLENEKYFVPDRLGLGLVEGYDAMGFAMSKPHLRAELEADLKRIIDGQRRPADVLSEQIAKYRDVFIAAEEQVNKLDEALGQYFNDRRGDVGANPLIDIPWAQPIMKCNSCEGDVNIRQKKDDQGYYLGCSRYPDCRSSLWFPTSIMKVEVAPTSCPSCGPDVRHLVFTLRPRTLMPLFDDVETICARCDTDFFQALSVRWSAGNRGPGGADGPVGRGGHGGPGGPEGRGPGGRGDRSGPGSRGGRSGPGSRGGRSGPGSRGGRSGPGSRGGRSDPGGGAGGGSSIDSGFLTGSLSSSGYRSQLPGSSDSAEHLSVGNSGNGPAECGCSVPAKSLTVKKEGPNQGRPFWTCGQPTKTCNFFLWGDIAENEPTNYAPRRTNGSGSVTAASIRTRGKNPRGVGHSGASSSMGGSGGTRKCGQCGQPGHNRLKCPENIG